MKCRSRHSLDLVSLLLLTVSLSNAQEKIRRVEKGPEHPNTPVEVVGRELSGRPFIDDTRVLGGQDWLRQLTLTIKNVSNKNIRSIDFDLLIRKEGVAVMGLPIYFRTYTKPTELNALNLQGEKKMGGLQPGEIVKVKVSDQTMRTFSNELVKHGVEDVDRVRLDLREVYFEDGRRWMFGQELGPDPNSPNKHGSVDKPKLNLSQDFLGQRFDEWMRYFIPIDASYSASNWFAFIYPAGSRIFSTRNTASVASPDTPPACVFLVNSEVHKYECYGANTHGCVLSDTFCRYEDFSSAVHASDPGGGLNGYMSTGHTLVR